METDGNHRAANGKVPGRRRRVPEHITGIVSVSGGGARPGSAWTRRRSATKRTDAAGGRRYAGICGASTRRRRRCWPCRTGRRHGRFVCFASGRSAQPKGNKGLGSDHPPPIRSSASILRWWWQIDAGAMHGQCNEYFQDIEHKLAWYFQNIFLAKMQWIPLLPPFLYRSNC